MTLDDSMLLKLAQYDMTVVVNCAEKCHSALSDAGVETLTVGPWLATAFGHGRVRRRRRRDPDRAAVRIRESAPPAARR